MDFKEIIGLLREFGFPTFFCLWLMYRQEKATKALTDQMTKMLIVLSVMARALNVNDEAEQQAEIAAKDDLLAVAKRKARRIDDTGVMKKEEVG